MKIETETTNQDNQNIDWSEVEEIKYYIVGAAGEEFLETNSLNDNYRIVEILGEIEKYDSFVCFDEPEEIAVSIVNYIQNK